MKTDAVTMTLLFDYYGELLTEKQKTCFDLYYNQDFSLGEIAENEGISRQGVHDSIARAESSLLNLENVLGCIARASCLQKALDTIGAAAAELAARPESIRQAETILSALASIKE